MPMLPIDVDSSTLAATSIASAAVTFAFCTLALDVKAGPAAAIAGGVGFVLYLTGVIPIGLLLLVGAGMIIAISKVLLFPTEQSASEPNEPPVHQPAERKHATPTVPSVAAVLNPYPSVKDALPAIEREIALGTQVPVLLTRVFPSMSFSSTHQINTYYVKLRSEENSKLGALTHALDEYVKSLGTQT